MKDLRQSSVPRFESAFATVYPLAKILAPALALLAVVTPAHAATNFVSNGGFEDNTGPGVVFGWGGYYQPTTIADWYVQAPTSTPLAGVDTYAHAITNTTQAIQLWGAAPGYQNGNGFSGSPDGGYYFVDDGAIAYRVGLKQDISGLTIGENYDLSFYYAFGQEACSGNWCNGATVQSWNVGFGSDFYNTPDTWVAEHGFSGWRQSTRSFTATSTMQTLQFWAIGPSGQPPMALLDGVSLMGPPVPAVPGPLPALGLGATFAWSARMRKRLKQANPS